MSSTDTFKIDVTSPKGAVVVTLHGSASMEVCDQLNDALFDACQPVPDRLIIDVTGLDFICSLGLGGLVAAYVRVHKQGGTVCLVGPQASIRDMLEVTKLGTLLPVYPTLSTAMAAG